MSASHLWYALRSGKNPKFLYYAQAWLRLHYPAALLRSRLPGLLSSLEGRADRESIVRRVDYYNQLTPSTPIDPQLWQSQTVRLSEQPMTPQKVYYLDAMVYGRYFAPSLRWQLLPSDITYVPDVPSVLKSRPLGVENAPSVLLKLNKVRHFIYVNDPTPFRSKLDRAVFRNRVSRGMPSFVPRKTGASAPPAASATASSAGGEVSLRLAFMQRWWGHPLIDAGAIDNDLGAHPLWNPAWHCAKMTIGEQLRYKFIMAIEGNEVASNLKWVMSSNSIAVCPRPRYETWFMEGLLKPDYHYIAVSPDFSDVADKLRHYLSHPTEAETILRHAHEWVSQFRDRRREDLISLLVLDKYFRLTPQD